MFVHVSNRKYTFAKLGLVIDVKRGGEQWVTLHDGFNAIVSLMCELDAARVVLEALRSVSLNNVPTEVAQALALHDRLVDDREPPSTWASPASNGVYTGRLSVANPPQSTAPRTENKYVITYDGKDTPTKFYTAHPGRLHRWTTEYPDAKLYDTANEATETLLQLEVWIVHDGDLCVVENYGTDAQRVVIKAGE